MAKFATVDDLEKTLRTTVDDIDAADQQLEQASALIQAYVGQRLEYVEDDVVILEEPPDGVIVLPERPVTAISSIEFSDGVLLDPTDYDWTESGTIVRMWNSPGWSLPCWGFGSHRKVTVTYSHGYQTIPNDIKMVCCSIAAHGWGVGPGGIAQESIGNYSVSYHGPGEEVGGPATVVILGKYRGMTVK